MYKNRNAIFSIVIVILLVVALPMPVFAQDEVEPGEESEVLEPDGEEEPPKFLDHPIVKLFAQFFFSLFNPPQEEEPVTNGEEGTDQNGNSEVLPQNEGDPNGEPGGDGENGEGNETEDQQIVPEEKIASMHKDDKLGFGVIAKLLELVRHTQSTCSETGEFCEVTLESLMEEYESGMSIGALFKKYGKPENLGVGQIRKELNLKEKTNNGKNKDD